MLNSLAGDLTLAVSVSLFALAALAMILAGPVQR